MAGGSGGCCGRRAWRAGVLVAATGLRRIRSRGGRSASGRRVRGGLAAGSARVGSAGRAVVCGALPAARRRTRCGRAGSRAGPGARARRARRRAPDRRAARRRPAAAVAARQVFRPVAVAVARRLRGLDLGRPAVRPRPSGGVSAAPSAAPSSVARACGRGRRSWGRLGRAGAHQRRRDPRAEAAPASRVGASRRAGAVLASGGAESTSTVGAGAAGRSRLPVVTQAAGSDLPPRTGAGRSGARRGARGAGQPRLRGRCAQRRRQDASQRRHRGRGASHSDPPASRSASSTASDSSSSSSR